MSAPEGMNNWNGEAAPLRCLQSLSLIWGAEERSQTLSQVQGAETPPGWSGFCIRCDRSADTVISGRRAARAYHSAMLWQRVPSANSACWEIGVSRHGLTGTVWSEASLGHSCGRIHLSSISSTWLQLNCQHTSIMPICFIGTWQLITQTSSYLTPRKNTNSPMCAVLQLVSRQSGGVTVTSCPSLWYFIPYESNRAILYLLLTEMQIRTLCWDKQAGFALKVFKKKI